LLLTMIAIIAKHQELPRELAKLYEHATKVLCHHWDVTGHKISVAETPADFMKEDDKLKLLRRIAWRMQTNGLAGNFILGEDLIDEKRVEEAAKELELSAETIRQHYEDITKKIPLQLSWKAD